MYVFKGYLKRLKIESTTNNITWTATFRSNYHIDNAGIVEEIAYDSGKNSYIKIPVSFTIMNAETFSFINTNKDEEFTITFDSPNKIIGVEICQ